MVLILWHLSATLRKKIAEAYHYISVTDSASVKDKALLNPMIPDQSSRFTPISNPQLQRDHSVELGC